MSASDRDDLDRLRIARERRRESPPALTQGGKAAFLGRVLEPDTVPPGVFATVAVEGVDVDEHVGATATFSASDAEDRIVLNLGPRTWAAGDRVIARHPDYRWVAAPARTLGDCLPCILPNVNLQATVSYYTDDQTLGGPPVPATTLVPLTLHTGTDSYLVLGEAPINQGSAWDGRVWRSGCLRFRSVANEGIAGTKTHCPGFDPYTFYFDGYIDLVIELFCDGTFLHLILYELGTGTSHCEAEPPQRCSDLDNFPVATIRDDSSVTWSGKRPTTAVSGYTLDSSVTCDPLHLPWYKVNDLGLPAGSFGYSLFNDIIITEP